MGKQQQDPPKEEPKPETPPQVTNATTKRDAPTKAKSTSSITGISDTAMKKRRGRGSLRIPLTSSGLSSSGVNFPTA
jgi:hypothetical protein